MTAMVVVLPLMVLTMACGVLLGFALVSGHAGIRLLPCDVCPHRPTSRA